MKYKSESERNSYYRDCLKPSWQELDFNNTDKGKKLPKPDMCKKYPEALVFDLEKDLSDISNVTVYQAAMTRRSVRQYKDELMTKKELSYLCNITCKIVKFGPGYAMGVIPTGGATSSIETYMYLHKVDGFKPGIYHYMKDTNQIQLIDEEVTPEMVNSAISNQLRGAQVIFFWTTTPYRAEYKYAFTAHKMIAMEAGHASQNLYLGCESINYGAVAIAAYNQELADKLLKIGEDEFVLYVAAVGKKLDK